MTGSASQPATRARRRRRPSKARRAIVLGLSAVLFGAALLVGLSLLASSGSVDIRLGDDRFDAGRTHLLTGGFGGFGLETARWLADRGVRHLVMTGRSGAATEEAKALDARNRERLTVGRTGRFDPYLSGTEQEARSKRSKSSMRSRAG